MSAAATEMAPRVPVRTGTARAADGDFLRWRVDGAIGPKGGVPLFCSNGIGVSTFFWHFIAAHFAPSHPVVSWDYRGHGGTPVPEHPEELTVLRCASDLWAVADAVGVKRAVLLGHSMGCQVSLEAFRQQPARVAALVPMLGAAGRVFSSLVGGEALLPVMRLAVAIGAAKPELAQQILQAGLKAPGLWQAVQKLGLVHPDLCPREEFAPYFAHLGQLDLRCYFALFRDLLTHDATDLLPAVHVPALVVAGSRDLFTPLRRSEEMASAIPDAELLVVRDGSHAALVEQPELIQLALEKFLRRNRLDQQA